MEKITPEYIQHRLEEAGATVLALPPDTPNLQDASTQIIRAALESYGWDNGRIRPPQPDNVKIERMKEALGWLQLIPQDRYVLRRVVGARSLVHPITDRHLFPWRRLSAALGADHKAVQRWHAEGVGMICRMLGDRT